MGVVAALKRIFASKKSAARHSAAQDRYCHCGKPETCPQYGPYRLFEH